MASLKLLYPGLVSNTKKKIIIKLNLCLINVIIFGTEIMFFCMIIMVCHENTIEMCYEN